MGGFKWGLLVGLVITWVAIVACVWRGATTVSKVVYATVLVPWVILIVFVIRGVTLPGAPTIGLGHTEKADATPVTVPEPKAKQDKSPRNKAKKKKRPALATMDDLSKLFE